ncbi:hypothetical protein BCV70DRAFT_163358 [Testicularia cyperi]|uniref:Glycosyl transferase CAP10 domain-containing protein n=1 Tax=Testicularia cyperi TaxID=1882483 RepID=A0A317XMJ8_9BASI|nr:hypothetical protein BCV70DRAFT_163358 [Testicularia cyperi]
MGAVASPSSHPHSSHDHPAKERRDGHAEDSDPLASLSLRQLVTKLRFRSPVVAILAILFFALLFLTPSHLPPSLRKSSGASDTSYLRHCKLHPISCRIDHAVEMFEAFRQRQSSSVAEAVANYQRRYKRRPPPGFERWVEYALQNNAVVIDDFDQLEADLEPFRKAGLTGADLRARMASAKRDSPGEMLHSLSITGGNVIAFGPDFGPMSFSTLERILEPVADRIPDVHVLFNWYAESRVLDLGVTGRERNSMNSYDMSGQATTPTMLKACPANHLTKNSPWRSLHASLDLCTEDIESLDDLHGFFQGPDGFLPFDKPLPILSRSKLSPFGDILIPNPCYSHKDYRGWNIPDTSAFVTKSNSVYWRGVNTGMRQELGTWGKGHRHRMMRYVKQLREAAEKLNGRAEQDPMELYYGNKKPKIPTRESIHVAGNTLRPFDYDDPEMTGVVKRLGASAFNVSFSELVNGNQTTIDAIAKHFPLTGKEPKMTSQDHKFVLDIDGQSMSCRLYQLLGTNSVVIKQTIWSEWHDDRLVPWLHYVPLDMLIENDELPRLLDYFINTPEGQERASMIATASRQWTEAIFRRVDLTLYYYRVMLELAALMGSGSA